MQRSFLPKNHDLIRNRGETEEENEKEQNQNGNMLQEQIQQQLFHLETM